MEAARQVTLRYWPYTQRVPIFWGAILNVLLGIDNSMKEKNSAAKNYRCIPVVFNLRGSGGLVVKETEVL